MDAGRPGAIVNISSIVGLSGAALQGTYAMTKAAMISMTQTLAVELYLEAGIRGVEIGSILADRAPDTHENRYPALELLRLAIPRRVYTDNHIRVIAAACRNIYERRAEITTGYRITFEAPILRHFTVELDKI